MEAPRTAARHDRRRDVRATYRPRHSRLHRRPRRPEGPLPPRTITSSLVHRPREDDRYLRQSDPRERPRRPAIERAEVGDDLGARQPGVHAHLRRAGRRARLQDRQSRPSGGDRGRAPAAPTSRIGPTAHTPGVGSRPESLTLASIYERHVTEIRREQPGARRIDASRLDAEVAVRMAVTGHSREQIAKAILDGARASRPHEDRDWQAYARRAVQRAFSAPGEQARLRLEPLRDKLLRHRRSPGRTTAPPRPWWSIEGTVIRHRSLPRITSPCRRT